MACKDLPSLSEAFGRHRQATLSDSNTATLPSGYKSAFATSMGSGKAHGFEI